MEILKTQYTVSNAKKLKLFVGTGIIAPIQWITAERQGIEMNVFDIIGPIMIGPSSSHTAGAVRLGHVARKVLGEAAVKAEIQLCGSFAQTYRGHGTDKALIAGILGPEHCLPRHTQR